MRIYPERFIDYSIPANGIRFPLMRYILGLRVDKRANSVTLKQIQKFFSETPSKYVANKVDDLVQVGYVEIKRSDLKGKTYVYELTEAGERMLLE